MAHVMRVRECRGDGPRDASARVSCAAPKGRGLARVGKTLGHPSSLGSLHVCSSLRRPIGCVL
eukprot:6206599-Prymnesium_polylepis.1